MNYNINTQATTFWSFLKENTIEIPIIQRDYAQGRLGKENLRKNFLADLKNALDNGGTMKLDFVYGSIENDNLNPLDGQQRLTTLWLLHWYIALRAGELSEDNCQIFEKFTYETRISSREFCQKLCKSKHFENFDGNDIVGFITKQTWFYSAWKQDPTIQSMLRMLGGTKVTNKKKEDIVDGIEELFKCSSECLIDCFFKRYWEKLTSDNAPVVFYHLSLKDFGLSDELYIKMNARGKQLTDFENFKADLIGYITKQAKDNRESEWKKLIDPESGIPIKIDTDWTDIFWKNKSNDNKIDEICFAFFNRYFLQELVCAKKDDNATDLYSADDLEKNNESFRHLYGEKGDDSRLKYSGLDKYLLSDNKEISHSLFTSIRDTLNNFKPENSNCNFFGASCLNTHFPTWVDSKFEFIPRYEETGNITTLGQKERVVFLAVCRYFEKGHFDRVSFKQWIRVVWNIVENSGIETIPAMIGATRLINELSEHSHEVYKFLSDPQPQIISNFAQEQVSEEIAKAKQILYGAPRSDGKSWEEIIVKAENYAFFKGAIRFLFTDGEANVNWFEFDTKWGNAQKYYDGNGVKDDKKVFLTKSLVIQCDNWDEQLYDKQIFNPNANTWKWILTSKNWRGPVHHILMGDIINPTTENNDKNVKEFVTPILKDLPFDFIINNEPDGRLRWLGPRLCFYKPRGRDMATFDWENWHRNKILSSLLRSKSITTKAQMGESDFFWGWNINFNYEYKGDIYYFQWWGSPNEKELDIYLMEKDWKDYKKRQDPPIEGEPDSKNYYCFPVTKDMETDTDTDTDTSFSLFTKELDGLIAQAFPKNPTS